MDTVLRRPATPPGGPTAADGAVAIEFNDIGVTVAAGGAVLFESPGYAQVHTDGVLVGDDAQRRAHLEPRLTSSSFWERLSTAPLPGALSAGGSYADLAAAHVAQLWQRVQAHADSVILAVPGCFSRQQLGLLLGIAAEQSVPVSGMLDTAMAAAREPRPGRALLYLDVHLHRALVTRLEQGRRLRSAGTEVLPGVGLSVLYDAWARLVAGEFVKHTRFDPMHHGDGEQQLYDSLPVWLRSLTAQGSLWVELRGRDGSSHGLQVDAAAMREAGAGTYARLVEHAARCLGGEPAVLLVSHRLAGLPGCIDALAGLPDCTVEPLPPGAAALGALRHAALVTDGPANALTTSLPWEDPGLVVTRPADPRRLRVTHLVYDGVVYPVAALPYALGVSPGAHAPGLALRAGSGVGGAHCRLTEDGDAVALEPLPGQVTRVNGTAVHDRIRLAPGDVLSLGEEGAVLHAVALEPDDEA